MASVSDENRAKILQLLSQGLASTEIAKVVKVSRQVVQGVKSHWTLGKYGSPTNRSALSRLKRRRTSDGPIPEPPEPPSQSVHGRGAWTYLLFSSRGEVYLGATKDLRARFRSHNSPHNTGFTRGRRWHLLAVRRFGTRKEAFDHEQRLKRSGKAKWKQSCIARAQEIARRWGYSIDHLCWSQPNPKLEKREILA